MVMLGSGRISSFLCSPPIREHDRKAGYIRQTALFFVSEVGHCACVRTYADPLAQAGSDQFKSSHGQSMGVCVGTNRCV